MASELSLKSKHQLERFCRQFLQLDIFQWPDPESLRSDVFQAALYARLFADNAVVHKPPPRYQLRILKELTRRIEECIVDWEEEGISDDLMTYLSTFLSSPLPSEVSAAQQKAYVTYTISSISLSNSPASTSTYLNFSNPPAITLLEARSLVAASGTTGLRTWEAALHFGHYLTTNPSIIKSKNILELGAGTGYLSILCAKHLGASHVLATDGSEEVVADLLTNFYLNGLQDKETKLGAEDEREEERERRAVIEAKELKWGQALLGTEHPQYNNGHPIDVVLGADVTYDDSAIMALVGTFGDLFELFPDVKIFIAATIRNEKTTDLFLESCKRARSQLEKIEAPILEPALQEGPFYADRVPIELYCITRSLN